MNHADTINPPRAIPEYIEPEWVDTPTSTTVWGALNYAQTTPTIAMVHGGAGTGKTLTAQKYLAEKATGKQLGGFPSTKPNVYMVRAHSGMGTITSALCAINEAMGYSGDAYRNDAMTRQILAKLNPGDLLIIDEAQNLDVKALNQIRHFLDVGRIGIAYLGNDEIQTRIDGRGRQAAFLGPLSSRVGFRLHIPHPTKEDVAAILSAWNVHGQKEHDYALSIGMSRVGLRGLSNVLRQGAEISTVMGVVLDLRVMRTAAANLGYN
jgi:hypothetical protein